MSAPVQRTTQRNDPAIAAVFVYAHAASMALAGVFEGIYVTLISSWGTWMAFDPHANRVGAFVLVAVALVRIAGFVTALFTAVLLVLAGYSLQCGQRRFVILANVLGILVPIALLGVNLSMFNCCTAWILPTISAVPATALGLGALPTTVTAPIRDAW